MRINCCHDGFSMTAPSYFCDNLVTERYRLRSSARLLLVDVCPSMLVVRVLVCVSFVRPFVRVFVSLLDYLVSVSLFLLLVRSRPLVIARRLTSSLTLSPLHCSFYLTSTLTCVVAGPLVSVFGFPFDSMLLIDQS